MRKQLLLLWLPAMALASCGANHHGPIRASGNIETVQVNVSAKAGGQIERILVDEGSAVAPGDTLAVIDHATLALQLRQAQAGVELARAQLDNDRKDSRRSETLLSTGSATVKQRDDAEARYKVSRARYDQAAATADLIRKQISDCFVTSPVRGSVTTKAFEAGETAVPGAPLVTVSRLERVDLMIYVTEPELARVRLGQAARVTIDADNGKAYTGTVVYISPLAEFTPKNVQTKEDRVKQVFGVKISIDNSSRELKPGMPADAELSAQ